MKRTDYISWDEYFMWIALLSAYRSKDPRTQVGACIVNDKKRIVGIWYNWFPSGCHDDDFPREKSDILHESKHAYVVHSEVNAILNGMGKDLNGSTLYVALFPCNECMKIIIQAGISHIKYLSNENKDREYYIASKKMADAAGIKYSKIVPIKRNITIDFVNYKIADKI